MHLQPGNLVVEDLHMTYRTVEGPVRAVRGVYFTVAPGEFYTLLGASGCGKTTVLRCIAGLETPAQGTIAIGSRVVYSSTERIADPPYRRDIGMVFQSYAVWPHLTVFDNVAFPLVSGRRDARPLRATDDPNDQRHPLTLLRGSAGATRRPSAPSEGLPLR